MEKKAREDAVPQKKKSIAFKSSSSKYDDEENEEDDEELSLFVRIYLKNKLNFRRQWEGKEEKRVICYNCRKPGHIMADCPDFKKKDDLLLEAKETGWKEGT